LGGKGGCGRRIKIMAGASVGGAREAEKQSRAQKCKRVRIEGRLRRVDACWADAGCEGGGMRSRDFVGAQG
jgi:hypothetical protein